MWSLRCSHEALSLYCPPGEYNHASGSTGRLGQVSKEVCSVYTIAIVSQADVGSLRLQTSSDYSDLKIFCGDQVFSVHKAVICPRSDFFAKACTWGKVLIPFPVSSMSAHVLSGWTAKRRGQSQCGRPKDRAADDRLLLPVRLR